MPRWEADTKQRLERSALDLFGERGYERTTVGDIADRAGVTSRTYFRYFPDKREVLFGGTDELMAAISDGVGAAPAELPPLSAAVEGMGRAASVFREREFLARREAVISTSVELREREVMKLAAVAAGLARALCDRGTEAETAELAADAAMAIFKDATRLWMGDPDTPYPQLLARAAGQLRAVVLS